MKLRRLTVRNFGRLRAADIALGPGLNVLFGPNDLGKSTLAAALRCCLLVAHSSTIAKRYRPWNKDERPEVTVELSAGPERIWRLHKRFASNGATTLEFSKDGTSFGPDAEGRGVDGKVLKLLRWGLESPGGRSGPRGMPDSFLRNVLLGEQADVLGVLQKTLAKDKSPSGKERLTQALQVLAQDPVFKQILAKAEERVDDAFTPKRKRKRVEGSPFQAAKQAVLQAEEEVQRCEEVARTSAEAERTVQELTATHERRRRAWKELCERETETVAGLRQQTEARKVEAELEAARQERVRQARQIDAVRDLKTGLDKRRAEVKEQERTVGRERNAIDTAQERLRELDASLRALQGSEAEGQRLLRVRELENARLKQTQTCQSLTSALRAAREGEERERRLETAREALRKARTGLAKAKAALDKVEATRAHNDACLVRAERLVEYAAQQRRVEEIAQAERAQAELDELEERVAGLREKIAAAEAAARATTLPSAEQVRALDELARQRDRAQARLSGGLSVHFAPEREHPLRAVVDGGAPLASEGRDALHLEAQRSVELAIEGVGRLTVTAGEKSARDRLQALDTRWRSEAEPVLTRHGCTEVDGLRALLAARAEEERQRERHRDELRGLQEKASLLRRQATRLDELRDRGAPVALDAALEEQLARWGDPGAAPFARRREDARSQREKCDMLLTALREKRREAVQSEAQEKTRVAELERQAGDAAAAPAAGWRAEAARLQRALEEARDRAKQTDTELERVEQEATTAVAELEAERSAVRKRLQGAQERLAELEAGLERAKRELHTQQGALAQREQELATLDLRKQDARISAIESRLAALPRPRPALTEADLTAVRFAKDEARTALDASREARDRARGALLQVGGQVAREQAEDAREALRLARDREQEVIVEYEAYKLLVDTLRESEDEAGAHLGKALSGPLSSRFGELTAGRYGSLFFDQDLKAEGLEVSGALRDVSNLSLGTQEQLATLLRLTIAEQLESFLLLDDQLTQADARRSAWFGTLLRDRAERVQTVVLTCRPEDYLRPEEMPRDDVRAEAGLVRAIDLERALTV